MEEKNILCIVPARGGSKGVPKKNIKDLNGEPLLSYSLLTANESKVINKIIVSTDSDEIVEVAKRYKCEVPFLRPKEYASDSSKDYEFLIHCLEWLKDNENYKPDLVVLLRPTTPYRDSAVVDKAINDFLERFDDFDSLRSSHLSPDSPFKWFRIKGESYTTLSDDLEIEDTNKPRQEFESVYIPNGYVDILKPEQIYTKKVYGTNIFPFVTEVTPEVDTKEEFEYLDFLSKKNNYKISENIESIKVQEKDKEKKVDYLDVCYSEGNRPYTTYPQKLAKHLFSKFNLNKYSSLLEIGCGRGEILKSFKEQGIHVEGTDLSKEAQKFNPDILIKTCNVEKEKLPYKDESFDVIFSKSLLEHLSDPDVYMQEVYRVLKPNGLLITLVPDWESCYKVYYDDYTHKTPFNKISLENILKMNGFKDVNVFKFRQLPIVWKYPFVNYICSFISNFVPIRSKIKFFRWSKELMLVSSAIKK